MKSKKGLFIAVGAVALTALLVTGGIVGFNIYRSSTYEKALAMLSGGDYQGAYDTFGKLGDYEDSAVQQRLAKKWLDYKEARILYDTRDFEAALVAFEELGSFEDSRDFVKACEFNIDYLQAVSDFNGGLFESALDTFTRLSAEGFQDARPWVNKTSYAIADEKHKNGDLYGAFSDFRKLGSYEDSADRMKQCTTPFPSTDIIYKNPEYNSTRSSIVINCSNNPHSSYFKLYNDTTLVAIMWVNGGEKLTISVPAGNYSIRQATGSAWFGEEIMFGDEGYYEVILFDADRDYFSLGDNVNATINLSVTGGNLGSRETDRNNF